MIFEEYELNYIISQLNDDDLMSFRIKTKLKEIMSTSRDKRYTLRTTDWCSDAGKKSSKKGVESVNIFSQYL